MVLCLSVPSCFTVSKMWIFYSSSSLFSGSEFPIPTSHSHFYLFLAGSFLDIFLNDFNALQHFSLILCFKYTVLVSVNCILRTSDYSLHMFILLLGSRCVLNHVRFEFSSTAIYKHASMTMRPYGWSLYILNLNECNIIMVVIYSPYSNHFCFIWFFSFLHDVMNSFMASPVGT